MNVAKARRRWEAWRRYDNRNIKLSEHVTATPGTMHAINEQADYIYFGYVGLKGARRYRRLNRRNGPNVARRSGGVGVMRSWYRIP